MSTHAPTWATLDKIIACRQQLPPQLRTPPLWWASNHSRLLCENLQITGSYKIRAAFTVLASYQAQEVDGPGVAISSSGNFAIAFAYAGHCLKIPISVVMMGSSSPFKAAMAESWGARVVRCGDSTDDRIATLERLRDQEGWWMVNHLEDTDVVLGHATLGLDLCNAWDFPEPPGGAPDSAVEFPGMSDSFAAPRAETPEQVLVPVSTAGLAAGVALVVKQRFPYCRVIGVQAEGSDAAARSFQAGHIVSIDKVQTECDALTANRPGGVPFGVIRDWLDDLVTVDEVSIRRAVVALLNESHLLVEPGGAVGYAALLAGRVMATPGTVSILSGGNLDLKRLQEWI